MDGSGGDNPGDRMWVEMPHTDVRSERRKNVENINVTDSPEM